MAGHMSFRHGRHTAATVQECGMPTPSAQDTRIANCSATNRPNTRSVSTCSDKDISVRGGGRGQIRTNGPIKAVRLEPQMDFQAAQGTKWVFRVSFL